MVIKVIGSSVKSQINAREDWYIKIPLLPFENGLFSLLLFHGYQHVKVETAEGMIDHADKNQCNLVLLTGVFPVKRLKL
jgi:hypothetical protein